jgi:hypothetical protein
MLMLSVNFIASLSEILGLDRESKRIPERSSGNAPASEGREAVVWNPITT